MVHLSLKTRKADAHTDGIWAVDVWESQGLVITGSLDQHLTVWERDCLTSQSSTVAHSLGVQQLVVAGDYAITSSLDARVRIWKLKSDGGGVVEMEREIPMDTLESYCVDLAPDASQLVTGSPHGHLHLHSVDPANADGDAKRQKIDLHLSDNFVMAVKFSPDGKRLAACTDKGYVVVVNAETHAIEYTFEQHLKGVRALAFSPDSSHLASGGDEGVVVVHELNHGDCVQMFNSAAGQWILSLAFLSDTLLASAHMDSKVRVWDLDARECALTLSDHSDAVWAVKSWRDTLITVSDDASMCVYQVII
eukprot:Partr_v1_DN27860_c1_g1_i1_m22898 putative WD repeat domain 61